MEIEVKVQRQLCIHAVNECLDEIVQHLLYFRKQIPSLVSQLLINDEEVRIEDESDSKKKVDSSKCSKEAEFRRQFLTYRSSVRNVFRSANRENVGYAAFVIGKSMISPKEVYYIHFDPFSSNDEDGGCQPMEEREMKKLSRCLLSAGFYDDFKPIAPMKFYCLLWARREAELQQFGFLPRVDLDLKRFVEKRKNSCNVATLNLRHDGCRTNSVDVDLNAHMQRLNVADDGQDGNGWIWFVYEPSLIGFS